MGIYMYVVTFTCITVNVDIFALYIFSRISRFLNMRENNYIPLENYISDSLKSKLYLKRGF